VEISTRNIGDKSSNDKTGLALLRPTVRSNGNSKIMGAAADPRKAFPRAIFSPWLRVMYIIAVKIITIKEYVNGAMGLGGKTAPVSVNDLTML
jgi:hypothetical protein